MYTLVPNIFANFRGSGLDPVDIESSKRVLVISTYSKSVGVPFVFHVDERLI